MEYTCSGVCVRLNCYLSEEEKKNKRQKEEKNPSGYLHENIFSICYAFAVMNSTYVCFCLL